MGPPLLQLRLRFHPKKGATLACGSAETATLPPSTSIHKPKQHWRCRLKEDPRKFKVLKKSEAIAARLRRAEWSEERRDQERAKSKERMRAYRLRKKVEAEDAKALGATKRRDGADGRKTRSEIQKEQNMRSRWAEEKRRQRAALSEEARRRINAERRSARRKEKEELLEYRRMRMEQEKEKREQEKEEEERRQAELEEIAELEERERVLADEMEALKEQTKQALDQENRSTAARRKSLAKARKSLPKSPQVFADTVADIIAKASPRKAIALQAKGIGQGEETAADTGIGQNLRGQLAQAKHKRGKNTTKVRRVLASALVTGKKYLYKTARRFGVTRKLLVNAAKPLRYRNARKLDEQVKATVTNFFEDQAVLVADKKAISRKTMKKTAVLQEPVVELFKQFRKKYEHIKIGFSSFSSLRPIHVKTVKFSKLRGCLCEYCTNISLKLTVLNQLCIQHNMATNKLKNEFVACDKTLCPKSEECDFHALECVTRQCSDCGINGINEHFQSLLNVAATDKVTWKKWKSLTTEDGRNTVGQADETGTVETLLAELLKELDPFALHLFTWRWQHSQYSRIVHNPPEGTVTMVMDFAENYACLQQDEVQAGHWHHHQATVHPIVATYLCVRCPTPHTVQHSLVYVSDDMVHDYHAVHKFFTEAVQFLEMQLAIAKIVRFSDGCSSQYKSRGPFLDISSYEKQTEHHFFGSRHGKGPSDGESAVVKRQASLAVKSGTQYIPNAKALYEYCKDHLTRGNKDDCSQFKRDIFWVASGMIDRSRPKPTRSVQGTRKIHSVKSISPGLILKRDLSCFCQSCIDDNAQSECENKAFVGGWEQVALTVDQGSSITLVIPELTFLTSKKKYRGYILCFLIFQYGSNSTYLLWRSLTVYPSGDKNMFIKIWNLFGNPPAWVPPKNDLKTLPKQ
ncbi:Reticulocyte-binding protein 2-like a [Holothuria leucospilota]|uniref:Reticulocyte-binding protein 2-like a n=1 Tax=Holothuria leucospilota TaxID=206669 RepID=A0A9Q1CEG1_HOLLE|nr:Reticulocyte-binding protein 2-like a [Holothuria leucospilota]